MINFTNTQKSNFVKALSIRLVNSLDTSNDQLREITHSIASNSCIFFEDDYGVEIGYLVWASVNDYSLERLCHYKIRPKYIHEWTEGNNIIILQLVLNLQYTPALAVLKKIRNFKKISYLNRNNQYRCRNFQSN